MHRVLVVGVGNPDRGDDALGAAVAARLAAMNLPGVRVCVRSGDLLGLIDEWRGVETLVLIDAAAPAPGLAPRGVEPGVAPIHRIDVSAQRLPRELGGHSTHGFGVAEAVELARALGALPSRAIVYAVEGQCFEAGAGMSAPTAAAIDEVTARIKAELEEATLLSV
jgi:hydrogenase maturation protease